MQRNAREIRAFIAIELPEPVKSFISGISTELKKCAADVKWTRIDGMHLTLKFLGSVRTELLPRLEADLKPTFLLHSPIELSVKGLGAFPGLGKPRVVWAGITEASGRLVALAAEVETCLEPLGFQREKRPFSPHLTLGRVRSNRGTRDLIDAIRQKMDIAGPTFVVDHAVLFESILHPSGAEYRPVYRYDFSQPVPTRDPV